MLESPVQRHFLAELERANKQLDNSVRRRLPVLTSCSTCDQPACCTQKILSPFFEAMPIARQLKREGRDSPELRARMHAEADAMDQVTRGTWFKQERPCVFLENGRCSVYENRPHACRTFYAISPAENCRNGAVDTTVKWVDVADLVAALLDRARVIHMMMSLRETRMRVLLATLPRIVAIALEAWDLENPNDYVRRQKWPTVDDIKSGAMIDPLERE